MTKKEMVFDALEKNSDLSVAELVVLCDAHKDTVRKYRKTWLESSSVELPSGPLQATAIEVNETPKVETASFEITIEESVRSNTFSEELFAGMKIMPRYKYIKQLTKVCPVCGIEKKFPSFSDKACSVIFDDCNRCRGKAARAGEIAQTQAEVEEIVFGVLEKLSTETEAA